MQEEDEKELERGTMKHINDSGLRISIENGLFRYPEGVLRVKDIQHVIISEDEGSYRIEIKVYESSGYIRIFDGLACLEAHAILNDIFARLTKKRND